MVRTKPVSIKEAGLVLVEGKDDQKFLHRLSDHMELRGLQILSYGGKDTLRDYLRTIRRLPGYESVQHLAIVRDADDNAENAFRSVRSALVDAELPDPPRPDEMASLPRVGLKVSVMIIPPGFQRGCLETLLWQIIKTASSANCISEYIDCAEIPARGTRRDRAKVHAYIAAQHKPGLKIGEASRAGYFDLDHAALRPVKTFLSRVVAN